MRTGTESAAWANIGPAIASDRGCRCASWRRRSRFSLASVAIRLQVLSASPRRRLSLPGPRLRSDWHPRSQSSRQRQLLDAEQAWDGVGVLGHGVEIAHGPRFGAVSDGSHLRLDSLFDFFLVPSSN